MSKKYYYSKIKKAYDDKNETLDTDSLRYKGVFVDTDYQSLCIYNQYNKIIFDSSYFDENCNAFKMFLEGRWWETLVANAVSKWANGRFEIWTSVEFDPKEIEVDKYGNKKETTKNEIDVLVKLGNTFLFIECKSGNFNQDNIYKLNNVRDTYGSEKSKAVLISLWNSPITPVIKEKAKENHVGIIVPTDNFSNLNGELESIIKSSNV